MKLALSSLISEIDRFASEELGISTLELVKRSGKAVADAVRSLAPKSSELVILAGKGNNGGDGYAAAIELMQEYKVTVYDVFSKGQKSSAGKHFLELYKSLGGEVINYEPTEEISKHIKSARCIVDAIFGTGFTGEMPESIRPLAITVREAVGAHKIAIDVPLGINADNGSVSDFVFSVEATVALSYIKPGILSYPARAYVGEIVYAPLGLPSDKIEENFEFRYNLIDEEWAADNLPERENNSNKGTFGKLLVICGSEKYRGAAHLALEAALRGGVGLVSFLGVESLVSELSAKFPEVIYNKCKTTDELTDGDISQICEMSKKFGATLIGSGSDNTDGLLRLTLALLSSEGGSLILDADSINALSTLGYEEVKRVLKNSTRPLVLTPHPLEFGRLIETDVATVQLNRLEKAEKFAKRTGAVLVLKGASTIITDGKEVYINGAGSSSLAKAGSGDVLAGLVGALVAQNSAPNLICSALAVYIHAAAGDSLATELSTYGVTPSDLPREIAVRIAAIQKYAKSKVKSGKNSNYSVLSDK